MAKDTLISQVIEQNEGNEYYKNFKFNYSDRILREHNQEVYEKIVKGLVTGNKVLFEQATGTGKSYLALKFLHDHAQGKRVLFVSPANAIKDSFIDTFAKLLGEDFCKLDTCLYQGLKGKQNKHYDIIIFDEVHRMGAKTWGPNAEILMNNNPNASILGMTATLDRPDCVDVRQYFDNREPVSSITLVEALEKGILPKPDYTLAKVDFEDNVEYIDTCIKDFKEKLKQAEGKEKKQILEFLERLKKAKQAIAESEDIPQIFANEITTKELKQGKFIVFCPAGEDEDENKESIHRMKTIMKQAPQWFEGVEGIKKIKKYCVYSKLDAKKNSKIIDAFERDDTKALKLLFSINMLNEGLHVDDIDGVIMLRSTGSRIIYLQQLGRALSVGHKHQPKIFDFVANLNYVDVTAMQQMATEINKGNSEDGYDGGNVDNVENDLRFKLNVDNLDTLQLIDTLKSNIFAFNHQNDFEFEDFCRRLYEYKSKYGDLLVPFDYIDTDKYTLGYKVSSVRTGNIKLNKDEKQKLTSMGFVWKAKAFDFSKFYTYLQIYKKENGNLLVPRKYVIDKYKLGERVSSIRLGAVQISEEQRIMLDEIGFVWIAREMFVFDKFLKYLKEYETKYGDVIVHKDYITEDGYDLGPKITRIRAGNIKLSEDEKKILTSMGFVWDATRKFDFDKFYTKLLEYKQVYGDLKIRVDYIDEEGYKLGTIASRIRSGSTKISDSQKEMLDNIGFAWDTKFKFDFDKFCSKLKEYKEQYGNLDILRTYVCDDGYTLGSYVSSIRSGNIRTNDEQKQKLNDIGFIWNATKEFDFDKFVTYLKKYGNCDTTLVTPDGYKLGQAIRAVRLMNSKNSLSSERKELLDSMGFVWNASNRFDFERFVKELIIYKAQFNNLKVKTSYISEDGYKLGECVSGIKTGHIKTTPEQRQQLIDLGLSLETKDRKFDFEGFYARLVSYKNKNGNLTITQKTLDEDGYPLGQKITNIKAGAINLTEAQRTKLIDLGLNLDVKKSKFIFSFEDFYDRLMRFKELNGHLNIKTNSVDEEGYPLGQKTAKIKSGHIKLTAEQKELLIKLGLNLTIKKSDTKITELV